MPASLRGNLEPVARSKKPRRGFAPPQQAIARISPVADVKIAFVIEITNNVGNTGASHTSVPPAAQPLPHRNLARSTHHGTPASCPKATCPRPERLAFQVGGNHIVRRQRPPDPLQSLRQKLIDTTPASISRSIERTSNPNSNREILRSTPPALARDGNQPADVWRRGQITVPKSVFVPY